MGKLPIIYRKSGEISVNFDRVDVLTGTGIIQFFAGGTKDSSGFNYILSPTEFIPSKERYDGSNSATHFTTRVNNGIATRKSINFDTNVLNKSAVLRGKALVNIPCVTDISISSVGSVTRFDISLNVVDENDNETEIATATGETRSPGNNIGEDAYHSIEFDVPKSKVNVGERIRLTVELFFGNNGGSDEVSILWTFHPQNEAVDLVDSEFTGEQGTLELPEGQTQMLVFLPFELQL